MGFVKKRGKCRCYSKGGGEMGVSCLNSATILSTTGPWVGRKGEEEGKIFARREAHRTLLLMKEKGAFASKGGGGGGREHYLVSGRLAGKIK